MDLPAELQPASYGVIAVIGGAIMDLVYETERMPEQDESIDALSLVYKPGGKGSNTAVTIYRGQHKKPKLAAPNGQPSEVVSDDEEVEARVYLNTSVGDDQFGLQLMANLQENGVGTSGITILGDGQTGTCAVFVESFSRNCRDIGYPGANTKWHPKDEDSVECLADGHKPDLIVTHLENDRKAVERVLAMAGRNGVETLLNPSPAYFLLDSTYRNVSHLLLNEVEVAELAGVSKDLPTEDAMLEACTYFMERGVQHVVITMGKRGAYYATEGAHGLVEAVKIHDDDVVDPTGSG